jgi:hypothetical protein
MASRGCCAALITGKCEQLLRLPVGAVPPVLVGLGSDA